MGLGAPKRRNKLSHDPNNTSWSKSTSNFGHKILASQGWKPGDYLGAENASHADHYTAANASHIRVLLREDNLGLGAQLGKSNAETFGLSTLSGIFGRLNGKSDVELQKQQDAQRDVELRTYQVHKHGLMNFVSGGLLVGDKIELSKTEQVTAKSSKSIDHPASKAIETTELRKKRGVDVKESEATDYSMASKKRKAHSQSSAPCVDLAVDDNICEKPRKRLKVIDPVQLDANDSEGALPAMARTHGKAAKVESGIEAINGTESDLVKERRRKERRKQRREDKHHEEPTDVEKALLKQEKRRRKDERRKRKEEKRCSKSKSATSASMATSVSQTSESGEDSSTQHSQVEQLVQPGLAIAGNRHAVRQRYIQQKRLASMDPQALREILMLKAPT